MNFKMTPIAVCIALAPLAANAVTEAEVNEVFTSQGEQIATVIGSNQEIEYQLKQLDGKQLAVYESDIILGEHEEMQQMGAVPLEIQSFSSNMQAKASWGGRTTWPNGVVPYVITSGVPAGDVTTIKAAMKWLEDAADVTFVERSNQSSYINIIRGDGCYSMVGRTGSKQDLSIGSGCGTRGIVAHEFLHALGFYHEQSRADRDQHVNIHWENIRPGMESNFKLGASVTASVGPYDVRSIMHYGYRAFSNNGQPTITSKNPNVPNSALGQRTALTDLDISALQTIYGLPNGGTKPTPEPTPIPNSKLNNGQTVYAAGSKDNNVFYSIDVPSASQLTVSIAGGSGDADLYVKQGSKPTTTSYDCRPYKDGNSESCTLENASGTVHVMLRGYADFANVGLTASYTASTKPTPAPTPVPTITPTQPPVPTTEPTTEPTPPPSGACGENWSASAVYTAGNLAVDGNKQYKANWWTKGDQPSSNNGQWQVWSFVKNCN
ncbi:M12 family metallopeptidase [Motilimonas cestriensis]|uniref:M12 family metallopeptidase n=1 Tax=Motilimonas cestriensis TaxID=2742685 RepID=UPI003DA48648